jgi:hypothetical protein
LDPTHVGLTKPTIHHHQNGRTLLIHDGVIDVIGLRTVCDGDSHGPHGGHIGLHHAVAREYRVEPSSFGRPLFVHHFVFHPGGEALTQPNIAPVGLRHQIAEPLVADLMCLQLAERLRF